MISRQWQKQIRLNEVVLLKQKSPTEKTAGLLNFLALWY
jgi:hypothetical protein